MLAKGWCIGSETQMSQDNTISLYSHCSTDAIKVMCSSSIKIWNFVVDEGIWSVVVVLMPHRASLFGEFWEREWAPANGEYTTFAFSSPKCCFPVWTKRYHQPLKTLPCKHTSAKSTICMQAHYWTSTDHPPCIEWESGDSHLPD